MYNIYMHYVICKCPHIQIIYPINMMVYMIYRYVIYYYHIRYDGLNTLGSSF